MRKQYEWTRIFFENGERKLRFQTNTDTYGQGLRGNVGTKCLHFLGGENQAKPRFGAIGLNAAFAAVLIASTGYFLL